MVMAFAIVGMVSALISLTLIIVAMKISSSASREEEEDDDR